MCVSGPMCVSLPACETVRVCVTVPMCETVPVCVKRFRGGDSGARHGFHGGASKLRMVPRGWERQIVHECDSHCKHKIESATRNAEDR